MYIYIYIHIRRYTYYVYIYIYLCIYNEKKWCNRPVYMMLPIFSAWQHRNFGVVLPSESPIFTGICSPKTNLSRIPWKLIFGSDDSFPFFEMLPFHKSLWIFGGLAMLPNKKNHWAPKNRPLDRPKFCHQVDARSAVCHWSICRAALAFESGAERIKI